MAIFLTLISIIEAKALAIWVLRPSSNAGGNAVLFSSSFNLLTSSA